MPNNLQKVETAILQSMSQFERIADRHKRVKWAEESQYALQICQNNVRLLECEPETIQDAIINVASVGLTLNPAHSYAYLVPEYNKSRKARVCQLRVSFRGLIKLAVDSQALSWVKADVVKEADTFEYKGIDHTPMHHMDPFSDRGPTVGAYCVAKTTAGDLLVDVISREQLDKIQKTAKTPDVWANWFDEMAKKAVIKRAAKQWPPGPKSTELLEAIEVINKSEGNDFDQLQKLEETAAYIQEHIDKDDIMAVGEAWHELDQDEMRLIWTAITKGGYFTQKQKQYIRQASQEYMKANAEDEDNAQPEVE